MVLAKKIFSALLGVVYFYFYYMGIYEVRVLLSIIACIIAALIGIYIIIIIYKHEQIKEYFWNTLDTGEKYFVNYGFHRSAFATNGTNFPLFSRYWEKEVNFQKKRNIVIIKCNKEKGNLLIFLEKKLCNLEILMFFLIVITVLSFDYA